MLLADCAAPNIEMASDNVVVVNDIVKDHDETFRFSPSIADSKKACLEKTNLLVLKFHYEDPQVWRFCPLNLLIPKEFKQTFFFKISPGTPWLHEGFWKLGSPKMERPIAMEDVRIAYEKYATHFEEKKPWLKNWWEGFPVKPEL